jgi:hypothetical protein
MHFALNKKAHNFSTCLTMSDEEEQTFAEAFAAGVESHPDLEATLLVRNESD